VFNGHFVGRWKRTFKKDTVIVVLNPQARLSPAEQEAFESAAHDYSDFLGMSVVLQ
jgi:hypothetical protein